MQRVSGLCCAIAAALAFTSPIVVSAQMEFTSHDVGYGISLALPSNWVVDSSAELAAVRRSSLEMMRRSSLQHLRDLAQTNTNTILFRAVDPANQRNSVGMNVTHDSTNHVTSFAEISEEEIAALVQSVCDSFKSEAGAYGGEGSCTGHELREIGGRIALLIHQRANIPAILLDNRRTVVMIPADGLLFTLHLSMDVSEYDAALARSLFASVTMPRP